MMDLLGNMVVVVVMHGGMKVVKIILLGVGKQVAQQLRIPLVIYLHKYLQMMKLVFQLLHILAMVMVVEMLVLDFDHLNR